MREFKLRIQLGNDLMRSPRHVAKALRELANTLSDRIGMGQRVGAFGNNCEGTIMDPNGNSVGTWEITITRNHSCGLSKCPHNPSCPVVDVTGE